MDTPLVELFLRVALLPVHVVRERRCWVVKLFWIGMCWGIVMGARQGHTALGCTRDCACCVARSGRGALRHRETKEGGGRKGGRGGSAGRREREMARATTIIPRGEYGAAVALQAWLASFAALLTSIFKLPL